MRKIDWDDPDCIIPVLSWTLVLIVAAIGVTAAIVVQGPMAGFTFLAWDALILALLAPIGTVALVSALVCAIRRTWRSSPIAVLSRRAALNVFLLVCVGIASFYLQTAIARMRLNHAEDWLIARVPAIEQYKETHGTYPHVLEPVADLDAAPAMIREGDLQYSGDGHRFEFDLSTGFLSGWSWSSEARRWGHYD